MNKQLKYWQFGVAMVFLFPFFSCEEETDLSAKTALIEIMTAASELISNTTEANELGAIAPGSKDDLQKQVDWANYILDYH